MNEIKYIFLENCALLGYYPASIGNSLSTFQDNLSVTSSRVKNPYLMASYFCLSNHNKLVSVSYEFPFCRKSFSTPFEFSLVCMGNARILYFVQEICACRVVVIWSLTLRLLMSYIYGAPSKARNANVVYIWTYVWQR